MSSTETKKKLNKKTIIFVVIGVVLVAAIVIALVIGLNNKDNDKDFADTSDSIIETNDSDDIVETDEITDTSDVTDDATDDVTDDTTPDDTTEQTQNTEPVSTNVNPNGVVITGVGSASEPYLEIPAEDMTVTTVNVPAGAELYYDIYRVGGMFLTVNDPDAYIICDDLLYEAENGQIYMKVPNALASDAVSFRVGNYSNTAKSFKLIFTSALGSYANPAVVDAIEDGVNISLAEGEETGFYCKHYAKQNGVIRFYMQASTDSVFIVTNNRNSAQRTSDADAQLDSNGNEYVEIEVMQGDELLINVGAIPNKRGKYPAVDIYWDGTYN